MKPNVGGGGGYGSGNYYGGGGRSNNKVINFDSIKELKDPIRQNEQIITKDDILNLKLDMYLFGKGVDIND